MTRLRSLYSSFRGALGGAGLAAVLGCASVSTRPLTLAPAPAVQAVDYEIYLKRWTRSVSVYDALDSRIFVHATLFSPEFEAAIQARFGEVIAGRVLPGLPLPSSEPRQTITFFVSAATSSPLWNDLERPTSIWHLTLEGPGHLPVEGRVKKVLVNANLRAAYPYITDFARMYVISFPRIDATGQSVVDADTRAIELRLVSGLGQGRLDWSLRPVGADAAPAWATLTSTQTITSTETITSTGAATPTSPVGR